MNKINTGKGKSILHLERISAWCESRPVSLCGLFLWGNPPHTGWSTHWAPRAPPTSRRSCHRAGWRWGTPEQCRQGLQRERKTSFYWNKHSTREVNGLSHQFYQGVKTPWQSKKKAQGQGRGWSRTEEAVGRDRGEGRWWKESVDWPCSWALRTNWDSGFHCLITEHCVLEDDSQFFFFTTSLTSQKKQQSNPSRKLPECSAYCGACCSI